MSSRKDFEAKFRMQLDNMDTHYGFIVFICEKYGEVKGWWPWENTAINEHCTALSDLYPEDWIVWLTYKRITE